MKVDPTRSAVITGLGIVSPIGIGIDAFWRSATAGVSGIDFIRNFDTNPLSPQCRIAGEVCDFAPEEWMTPRLAKVTGRFSQFAIASASMAIRDSGLDRLSIPSERIVVSIGTSMSGLVDVALPEFEAFKTGSDVLPWTTREYPGQAATGHVARLMGAVGAWNTSSSACAAGLDAISWAAERIFAGHAIVALAGASETPLSPGTMESFRRFGLLSHWDGPPGEASRPFDRSHSGLVAAEGAAIVVVEQEEHARLRGASIYARVMGSGSATEASSGSTFDRNRESGARSMRLALEHAHLAPSAIDYVSAHGNSIPENDVAETAALKLALGSHAYNIPISSLKSMCGQAFAASSAMQVVASCLTLRDQTIPPTINFAAPDRGCDLDYVPNRARVARVRVVLLHVRSIGGSHASMILGLPD
jgi:3-oxoacyl-[acyl-carrier-protein] synthase II